MTVAEGRQHGPLDHGYYMVLRGSMHTSRYRVGTPPRAFRMWSGYFFLFQLSQPGRLSNFPRLSQVETPIALLTDPDEEVVA